MKRSVKKFLSLFLSFALFYLLFVPLSNFILEQAFFKTEIVEKLSYLLSNIPSFSREFCNKAEMLLAIKNSAIPSLLQDVLLSIVEKSTFVPTISKIASEYVYKLLTVATVGLVLFAVLYVLVSTLLSIVFLRIRLQSGNLFITKRVLAGGVGSLRGALVFVAMEFVLVFVSSCLSLEVLQECISQSQVAKVGLEAISSQVALLLGKLSL